MSQKIYVSSDPYETRVAVIENEQLVEAFIQPAGKKSLIGNIYKGQVASVIPGLEAAFVDIGIGRNAFLHVHDYAPRAENMWEAERMGEEEDSVEEEGGNGLSLKSSPILRNDLRIDELLREDQSVLVQMEKESLGQKGCRVTAHISLPGRYLVLFPTSNHVAISRRIEGEEEREALHQLGQKLVGDKYGIILRTASRGVPEEEVTQEFHFLVKRWENILRKSECVTPPALVYEQEGLVYQVVRDLCTSETDELIVEGKEVYERLKDIVRQLLPLLEPRIRFYREPVPLFRATGIDAELERVLQRRVWLKSGGYLVIDETEALTVVDVNTGRDLGRRNLEETAFATNLEATREIARQLRLRDIGGIIVVDFIDMLSPSNQRLVMEQLKTALAADRSHPTLFSMTELGLVQLTRKRVRKSLLKSLSSPCPYCKGEGIVFSEATMVTRILRRIEELLLEDPRDTIILNVHPSLSAEINTNWSERLEELSATYDAKVRVVADQSLHVHEIRESFSKD